MPVSQSISYYLCFAAEVLVHLNIKYHVAIYSFITWRHRALELVVLLEGNAHIFHFLCDRVAPQVIVVLTVNGKSFINILWNSNSKHMSPQPVL